MTRPIDSERRAVRAILLTPEREVLLLRLRPPSGEEPFWVTPGGGMEPGETAASALARELREEIGLTRFELGPLVWRRQHTFDWRGRRIRQHERYHVVLVDRFDPVMSDALEANHTDRFLWCPLAALGTLRERLTPTSLAAIIQDYLERGAPCAPPEVEILED